MNQYFTPPPQLDQRCSYSAPDALTVRLSSRNVLCSSVEPLEENEEVNIFE